MKKIIGIGAEAALIQKDGILIKKRLKKSYRIQELDEKLRKTRTRKEAKLLEKAFNLIPVPKIIKVSENNKEIEMQFIEGKKLSECLDNLKKNIEVCRQIGNNIAKLHDSNIIHGDLTTSNMLLKKDMVYFVDFGLGFESARSEDKAVDLHLIKEALAAKHYKNAEKFWHAILEGYKISRNYSEILDRLKKVEARGRYKQSY